MNIKVKIWLQVAVLSVVACLSVCWLPTLNTPSITSWGEMMWLFATTYCLLIRNENKAGYGITLSAALTGALIIPCVIYAVMWSSSFKSIIYTASMTIGILLATLCHYKKSPLVFLLAVALMILFNTFAVAAWVAAF